MSYESARKGGLVVLASMQSCDYNPDRRPAALLFPAIPLQTRRPAGAAFPSARFLLSRLYSPRTYHATSPLIPQPTDEPLLKPFIVAMRH